MNLPVLARRSGVGTVRWLTLATLLSWVAYAFAGSATLLWDPVNSPALAGYVVYQGTSAGTYPTRIDVGNTTTYSAGNLVEGATYHFAVTAYDSTHEESAFSNDVAATVPYSSPIASFNASTTTGVAPLALNFSSTSSGNISAYAWNFGDGGTSTANNPAHVYIAVGIYTVTLTVTGPGGSDTQMRSNYIAVSGPATVPTTTALASSSNPINVGASVTFTATVTGNSPTGSVNFADGGVSIGGCATAVVVGSGNARNANCTTTSLTSETHNIIANYSGDSTNGPSSSAVLAQVVVGGGFANGGFETPNLAGAYQYAPIGATWVFTGNAGITGNVNAFTSGNPSAPEGVQVAFLQGAGAAATQTAAIPSGQYTLSLWAAQRGNVQSGAQIIRVQVDGVTVGQYQPPGTSYTAYQTPAFAVGAGASHAITLTGVGSGGDFTGFVDNVVLIAAPTNGFDNGGFETPNLGGSYQYTPVGATWTFAGSAGITGNANAFTIGNPPAPEGVQVAFLQGPSAATQTAAIVAGQYTLSLQAAQRGNFQSGTQVILVQVDGVTVGQYQPPDTNFSTYQTPTFTIAFSGSHTIALTGAGSGGDFTGFVDNVTLTAAAGNGFANGGFETPNLDESYQYAPAGATWVFVGTAGITGNGNAFTSGNPPAPQGEQVAFLQGFGAANQTAALAAGRYTLSIEAAQRGNFQSGTQVIRVQVDGTTVGEYQPPDTSFTLYQTPVFTIGSSGSHTITLTGVGSGSDFTAFVDNVTIVSSP